MSPELPRIETKIPICKKCERIEEDWNHHQQNKDSHSYVYDRHKTVYLGEILAKDKDGTITLKISSHQICDIVHALDDWVCSGKNETEQEERAEQVSDFAEMINNY